MNFWKKLKNWRNYLIHWLGGYSEAEYKAAELRAEKLREENERCRDELEELSWTVEYVEVPEAYPPYEVNNKLKELLITKLLRKGYITQGELHGAHFMSITVLR